MDSGRRWQAQHSLQQDRFALQRERFELAKQKEERLAAKREAKEQKEQEPMKTTEESELPPLSALMAAGLTTGPSSKFQQTLYIGWEDNETTIYEVTPPNETIRAGLSDDDKVVRVYNFVGGVPPEYKYLITPDAISWGDSTSVRKIYSAEEWSSLANAE